MQTRSKILMGVTLVVLLIGLAVGVPYTYRHSGPSFDFTTPEAITVLDDGVPLERTVKFPNFLPTQWQATFSPTPLFKAGDVVEIDVDSLEDLHVNNSSLRVENHPIDMKGKDVNASYIFYISNLPENKKRVIRVKIDYVAEDTIAHRQKDSSGEWFWLREIYSATLIN